MDQTRVKFKKQRRKKSRAFKFFKTIGLFTLVLFIIGGSAFAYMLSKVANATSSAQVELTRGDRSEMRQVPVNPSKDNISILFLGVDDRDGNTQGRTDALVLATFNKQAGTVKLLSIPRDSRVEIVGKDRFDKINHAHAFGGLDMTVATVENLLNIPVDYFVKLNFDAFVEIIDSLDGIEVDVPYAFSEQDSHDRQGAIQLNQGLQTLSGEEALAYARMRKQDPLGDIGRGERQQQILEAIIKKSASFSSITKFDDVMKSVEENLSTNLSFGNLLALHSYSSHLNNIESLHFEGDNATIRGIYYYELNSDSINQISTTLREHLQIN